MPPSALCRAVVPLPALSSLPVLAEAQAIDEVFRRINPSVVVIKARGKETAGGRTVGFTETGPARRSAPAAGPRTEPRGRAASIHPLLASAFGSRYDQGPIPGGSPPRHVSRRDDAAAGCRAHHNVALNSQ